MWVPCRPVDAFQHVWPSAPPETCLQGNILDSYHREKKRVKYPSLHCEKREERPSAGDPVVHHPVWPLARQCVIYQTHRNVRRHKRKGDPSHDLRRLCSTKCEFDAL